MSTEPAPAPQPIILTLQIDEENAAFFNRMREAHFPPEINFIDAHLTLFHNLPGAHMRRIIDIVAAACARRAPFSLRVDGLMKLGRGVAYRVSAPELIDLREELARAFAPWLTRQDKQKPRPHITVQNKTTPARATALLEHLERDFAPFEAQGQGVQLWFYEGGPGRPGTWAPAGVVAFSG